MVAKGKVEPTLPCSAEMCRICASPCLKFGGEELKSFLEKGNQFTLEALKAIDPIVTKAKDEGHPLPNTVVIYALLQMAWELMLNGTVRAQGPVDTPIGKLMLMLKVSTSGYLIHTQGVRASSEACGVNETVLSLIGLAKGAVTAIDTLVRRERDANMAKEGEKKDDGS